MIKLSTNISKKVPVPGQSFSSQQFGAAMEIEVADADDSGVIQQRIRDLYALLCSSVDEQISRASSVATPHVVTHQNGMSGFAQSPMSVPSPLPAQRNGLSTGRNRITTANGNGNGRRVTATEAQVKCIHAVCRARGLDVVSVLADFNVADPKDLHIKEASRLIDQIKNSSAA